MSLELLLKLVAVFGPGIRSAVSAPRAGGVDLHAEERYHIQTFDFQFLSSYG